MKRKNTRHTRLGMMHTAAQMLLLAMVCFTLALIGLCAVDDIRWRYVSEPVIAACCFALHFSAMRRLNSRGMRETYPDSDLRPWKLLLLLALGVAFVYLREDLLILQAVILRTRPAVREVTASLQDKGTAYVTLLFCCAALAGWAREMLFHGTVMRALEHKYGTLYAILMSSALCALSFGSLPQFLPELIVSIGIGYAVQYTSSMLVGIVLRAMAAGQMPLMMMNGPVDIIGLTGDPHGLALLAAEAAALLAAFILLLCLMRKGSRSKEREGMKDWQPRNSQIFVFGVAVLTFFGAMFLNGF